MKARVTITVKERGKPARVLKMNLSPGSAEHLQSIEGALARAVYDRSEPYEWWECIELMTLDCGGWLDSDMPDHTPYSTEREK